MFSWKIVFTMLSVSMLAFSCFHVFPSGNFLLQRFSECIVERPADRPLGFLFSPPISQFDTDTRGEPTPARCITIMTSANGNIFRVTGLLCGEFTGHRWIPRTKASDAELWCFFYLRPNKRLSRQWWGWWYETPSRTLWRHCNVQSGLVITRSIIF